MQPPTTVDPSPPGIPPRRRLNQRTRLVVAVLAGVVALLCLGGVGVFVTLYDRATEIDRQEPDQVVSSYLRAYLVARDDQQAKLLTCDGQAAPRSLQALRADVESRERSFAMTVTFSWGSMDVQRSDGRAAVQTELRRAISDGSESVSDRWSFEVVDRGGWRVCGAAKAS